MEAWFFNKVMRSKDADGMANSLDWGQSDMSLHCFLLTPTYP